MTLSSVTFPKKNIISLLKTIDLIAEPRISMPLHYYFISGLVREIPLFTENKDNYKNYFLKHKNKIGLPFVLENIESAFFTHNFPIKSFDSLINSIIKEFNKMKINFSIRGVTKTLPIDDFRLNVFKQIVMETEQEYQPADETRFISYYIRDLIRQQNFNQIYEIQRMVESSIK